MTARLADHAIPRFAQYAQFLLAPDQRNVEAASETWCQRIHGQQPKCSHRLGLALQR